MGLISDKVNESLNRLIQMANDTNRMLDRHMSLMNTKFLMKETAHMLHPAYAHYFSLVLADKLAEYQEERFNFTMYYGTDDTWGTEDYDSPEPMFEAEVEQIYKVEEAINATIDMARDDSDNVTVSFLHEILEQFKDIAYLASYLHAAAVQQPTDTVQLDDNISRTLSTVLFKKEDD